jgi:transposase
MDRFDLTDAPGERLTPLVPDRYHHGQAGPPWTDHRPLVTGLLGHLHPGAPWPDTPERYGPGQTVYGRFNRWRQDGPWATTLDALLPQLDRGGFIDRDRWCFDGPISRAHAPAAGAKQQAGPRSAAGRCRGGASAGA